MNALREVWHEALALLGLVVGFLCSLGLLVAAMAVPVGLVVLLTGCAGTRPIELPKTVEVPVTVPCVVDRPARPDFRKPASIAADATMSDYQKAVTLAREIERRDRYEIALEAATAGCR